ncbi:MAG: thioesterase [Planktomarina sp.]|nr:thioesterase [Planktomarina sp.]
MVKNKPSTRDDYIVFSTITTRWFDNDVYGHMNNTIHYQLFDTAVHEYLLKQGILNSKSGSTVFLVVETGCKYFNELAFPDVISAGIKVRKLGSSSVTYDIGLFRGDADQASAQGHFVHVNVDRVTRRPVNINDENRDKLKLLM